MPVTLNIIESTTALGLEVVEVVLASASEPGPAGPGVPAGGTDGQVLTKASATDYDTAWEDATGGPGGGAPTDATYLVTAAHADLSAEVVVGATPGGELGGTWASPTVDATHSGSSHASTQAAAEATAAAALAAHVGAADPHTGYRLESVPIAAADVAADVATQAELNAVAAASVNDGDAAGGVLSGTYPNPGFAADMATQAELDAHVNDISAAHAASAVSADSTTLSGTGTDVQAVLEELDNLLDDHSARHEDGGADEISIQGLAGTPTELTNHLNDATDAHDASAISVLDSGASYTATDVEGVLAELYDLLPLELDYVENASNVAIASTSEASPTTVITGSDLSVDGSTVVMVEFYCRALNSPSAASSFAVLNLHASTNGGSSWTDLGRILSAQRPADTGGGVIGFGFTGKRRLTPAQGTVMYRIVAWASSTTGSPIVLSGSGGAGAGMPIFLRVTKVVAA